MREGLLILFAALALFLGIALLSYNAGDPSWSHTGTHAQIHNAGGAIGALFADISLSLFGYFAFLLPIIILYLSWVFYRQGWHIETPIKPWMSMKIFGMVLLLCGVTGFLSLTIQHPFTNLPTSAGGMIGDLIQQPMNNHLGEIGTGILFIALMLSGVTLLTGFSWLMLLHTGAKMLLVSCQYLLISAARYSCQLMMLVVAGLEKLLSLRRERALAKQQLARQVAIPAMAQEAFMPQRFEHTLPEPAQQIDYQSEEVLFDYPESDVQTDYESYTLEQEDDEYATFPDVPTEIPAEQEASRRRKKPKQQITAMPHLELLDDPIHERKNLVSQSLLQEMAELVEAKLRDFGVQAQVVAVNPGPVITRFELQLAAGVKVSKVSNLAKDLARSLSVISVRIVDVIPGKTVIGLEVPNEHREIVRLREVLASKQYNQASSPLSIGLGKDIAGVSKVVDIARMPHLLVAGTTGSGKSVCLNAILLSLLYKATPEQVRMIMIDPKMLELSIYEGIPHLLTPVVTDMKEAANALRWCVAEMEKRYQLMAAMGVRNIAGYNEKVRAAIEAGEAIENPIIKVPPSEPPVYLEPLPYIVVLVDEFADMMMVVGKKVEELIARIAQKARAAGIHLILATQRPSVDVITGLIKANIPCRIAFQVSSKIDSRTVIDQPGAEQLLGHGDMLYLPPGAGLPVRIHGAYVADEEVHAVVGHLKAQGEPDYLPEILCENSGPQFIPGVDSPKEMMDADPEMDPLYDQAVRVVTETRRASISQVQRRLKIGYNRAARLLEAMELSGVVSTMEANGTREVLAPPPIQDD